MSWRRRRCKHVAPAASSRPDGAPEQLLDNGEAPEAWVDGGGARLGLGFGDAIARAGYGSRVGFRVAAAP
jgi:hypothetical protein